MKRPRERELSRESAECWDGIDYESHNIKTEREMIQTQGRMHEQRSKSEQGKVPGVNNFAVCNSSFLRKMGTKTLFREVLGKVLHKQTRASFLRHLGSAELQREETRTIDQRWVAHSQRE